MYGSRQQHNRHGGSSSPNSVAVDTTKLYETLGVRSLRMPSWGERRHFHTSIAFVVP